MEVMQNCSICGCPIIYSSVIASMLDIVYSDGHYIYALCDTQDALSTPRQTCAFSRSTKPLEILEKIMVYTKSPMPNLKHYTMVPAVFMSVVCDNGYQLPEGELEWA